MKRIILLLIGICLLACPAGAGENLERAPGESHGAELTLRDTTPLAVVLADPERFEGTPVLLRGSLLEVCQRKGCWTILRDGESQVRIRFKDYGFFIPIDSRGAEVLAQGVATVRVLSESDARHYESERSGGDPSKIEGPQREVGFEASGLRLVQVD